MPLVLNQTSAPATNPVTLAEAKLYLKIDMDDMDDLITEHIATATSSVQTCTNRQLVSATYTLNIDRFPFTTILESGRRAQQIEIPRAPLQSVSSIQYYDTDNAQQTLASSVYTVDTSSEPGRIYLAPDQSWPDIYVKPEAVTITYIAGYGAASAVPEQFKTMVKMMVEYLMDPAACGAEQIMAAYQRLCWQNKVPTAA